MLLALSVIGGLAMPATPETPSYEAGAWHRFFPVQKVHAPRAEIATTIIPGGVADAFLSGDFNELSVADTRTFYTDGIGGYVPLFHYRVYKDGAAWATLRLIYEISGGKKRFGLDNYEAGVRRSGRQNYYITTTETTTAAGGTAVADTLIQNYGGSLKGTTDPVGTIALAITGVSTDFYYHHARKGGWRVDIIALQTAAGKSAAIDLATQQFVAIT